MEGRERVLPLLLLVVVVVHVHGRRRVVGSGSEMSDRGREVGYLSCEEADLLILVPVLVFSSRGGGRGGGEGRSPISGYEEG